MSDDKLHPSPPKAEPKSSKSLKLIKMDEIQATETAWLWFPYIPYGKITIIQGDPGEGKTTLVLNLAASLTGGEIPDTGEPCVPVTVIYQTAEDGLADTIKPRLDSANADCRRVLVIDETEKCISMTDERLEEAIKKSGARFVILDPLQAYLGSNVDMHRANEIRPVMSHLGNIAEKYGCAIVLIGHMNKAAGMKASYRGLGSIDLAAAARSVLIVARDKDHPQIRVVIQTKSSLAPEGKPVAFELDEHNGFHFIGEYDIDPDDLLMGIQAKSPNTIVLKTALYYVISFRKDILPMRRREESQPYSWKNDAVLDRILAFNDALNQCETLQSIRHEMAELEQKAADAAKAEEAAAAHLRFSYKLRACIGVVYEGKGSEHYTRAAAEAVLRDYPMITHSTYSNITRMVECAEQDMQSAAAKHQEITAALKEKADLLETGEHILGGGLVAELAAEETRRRQSDTVPNGYIRSDAIRR